MGEVARRCWRSRGRRGRRRMLMRGATEEVEVEEVGEELGRARVRFPFLVFSLFPPVSHRSSRLSIRNNCMRDLADSPSPRHRQGNLNTFLVPSSSPHALSIAFRLLLLSHVNSSYIVVTILCFLSLSFASQQDEPRETTLRKQRKRKEGSTTTSTSDCSCPRCSSQLRPFLSSADQRARYAITHPSPPPFPPFFCAIACNVA
jgi:hypothetical protein